MKNWVRKKLSVFNFVCFKGRHFAKLDFAKKGQCIKFVLTVNKFVSNFLPYMKKLEMYFAILICLKGDKAEF